jgi:SAM-dependent methyltransferase
MGLMSQLLFRSFAATPQGKRLLNRIAESEARSGSLLARNSNLEVALSSAQDELSSMRFERNQYVKGVPPLPEDLVNWTLHSREEWVASIATQTRESCALAINEIVSSACRSGVWSPFFGQIGPDEVEVRGDNYREALCARGFNPRQRAVLDRILDHAAGHDVYNVRIYAHEALTPVALALRGRYPKFIGSEYAIGKAVADDLYPIPAIDITDSPLPDSIFDFVISNEVLEHVPDLDAALRETARILKPGGMLLGTCPFNESGVDTDVRAVLEGSEIRHLAEPEYHGNPVDPEGGSLVFQVPGWDLLERARTAGFSNPRMHIQPDDGLQKAL